MVRKILRIVSDFSNTYPTHLAYPASILTPSAYRPKLCKRSKTSRPAVEKIDGLLGKRRDDNPRLCKRLAHTLKVLVNKFAALGIRTRLVALVVLATLPLVVLLSHQIARERHDAIATASDRALQIAQLAAEKQAVRFHEGQMLLDILRRMPELQNDAPRVGCRDAVRRIARNYPQFSSIGVVNSAGELRCHSIADDVRAVNERKIFDTIMAPAGPDLALGKYRIGVISRRPSIKLARPIVDDAGQRQGMVFVSFGTADIARIANSLADNGRRTVIVYDREANVVIAHSGNNDRIIGTPFFDGGTISELQQNPAGGTFEAIGLSGSTEVFGAAPLPIANNDRLVVAVGIPRISALADAEASARNSLALAVTTISLIVLLAWLVGYWTQVRPIRRLGRIAERVGSGDLAARTTLEYWQAPEFRLLGQALDSMAAAVAATQEKLKDSEMRYRWLAEHSADMVFKVDNELVRRYVSPAALDILGYEPDELIGSQPFSIVHPQDVFRCRQVFQNLLGDDSRAEIVMRVRHKDGHWVWVETELKSIKDEVNGNVVGIIGAMRDISERKEFEDTLAHSEARYRLLAENSADLVTMIDGYGKRTFVSPTSQELLGYSPDDLLGGSPLDVAHPDHVAELRDWLDAMQSGSTSGEIQYRARHKSGDYIWLEASGKPIGTGGLIISYRNIAKRKAAEEALESANRELERIALIDGLTGLHNRRSFDTCMAKEFARCARAREPLSVLLVDVDHFKNYNDSYGHPAGDECLRWISATLDNSARRPADLAARYGGEELAIILPETPLEGALVVAEVFRGAVEALRMTHLGNACGVVTVSVGVATVRPDQFLDGPDDLIELADKALYEAKRGGRNRVCAHRPVEVLKLAG